MGKIFHCSEFEITLFRSEVSKHPVLLCHRPLWARESPPFMRLVLWKLAEAACSFSSHFLYHAFLLMCPRYPGVLPDISSPILAIWECFPPWPTPQAHQEWLPCTRKDENKLHSCCPRLSRKIISWGTHPCSRNSHHPVQQPHSQVPGGEVPTRRWQKCPDLHTNVHIPQWPSP